MRLDAKASTAGSTQHKVTGLGRFLGGAFGTSSASSDAAGGGASSHALLAAGDRSASRSVFALASLLLLCFLALLFAARPALAGTVTNERSLLFSFDGSGSSHGPLKSPGAVATDETTGNLFVSDVPGEGKGPGPFDSERVVCRFDADGLPQAFASTGESCIDGSDTPAGAFGIEGFPGFDVAIDNSGGSGGAGEGEQGRLYVSEAGGPIHAYDSDGAYLWTLPKAAAQPCGIAVDAQGHLWVGNGGSFGEDAEEVLEFDNTGSPPAEIGSVTITNGSAKRPCHLGLSEDGSLYVHRPNSGGGIDKYVGGAYDSTLIAAPELQYWDLTVDQSQPSGHIFMTGASFVTGSKFEEFEPCAAPSCPGSPVAGSPFGRDLLGVPPSPARSIAYNPSKDWVYVSESATDTVKVFGPRTSGTVPDPVTGSASEIGVAKAKLNGTVNPQSVPNSYHFEWKAGEGASWALAKSSPEQSLPEDSAVHSVSFDVTGLKGNTNYQVRLVATNTENTLDAYGATETLTTATPSPPAVTIDSPTSITTTSVEISGTVNPQADLGTTWRLQTSTDPACASGFDSGPVHEMNSESTSPVAVSEELTGLLPNQHYCVRISAINGGGTVNSAVEEFVTDPVAPTEVETAFAAPRLDTTARLNARVNPEGATSTYPLVYRFEYREAGAEAWTALPEREYTDGGHQQVFVFEEVSGLTPNTAYEYRFSAENDAGPASPQGEIKLFKTRTTAEVTLPAPRGIELVNNPDKGNQNAVSGGNLLISGTPNTITVRPSGISLDGEKATWAVSGGAPGAPNGTASTFLAERTASGWRSRSLAPPASQQVGGGDLFYLARAATPDFSRFVFDAEFQPPFGESSDSTRLRLDAHQHQEILQTYSWTIENDGPGAFDMTDDGAHVIDINHASDQLQEIGDGSGEVLSIMPDGTQSSCGLEEGPSFVGGPNGGTGEGAGPIWRQGYHAIATTDASRVYFEAKPNGECGKPWGLYVRNRESEETTLIDAGTATNDVGFITATPDGRAAYFVSFSQLDPADGNEGADLYRWEEQSEESSCLTCVVPNASLATSGGPSAPYRPILISADFSHAYFESSRELVAGHPLGASERNVYVLSGGQIRFVTKSGNFATGLFDQEASWISADGTMLAFADASEPFYTADTIAGDGNSRQIYLYDDREASLECVSCTRDGATTHPSGPRLEMSADGSTLAFISAEGLTPRDVNRTEDVYEWRGGVQRLITDGVSEYPAGLLSAPIVQGIDADGSNILFSVVDPDLTGYERDGVSNLYVARIGGGFPRPTPAVHCDGDACQGPLVAPPVPGAAGSASFSGRGNVAGKPKARCRKGRVRRKGRCVKRRANQRNGRASQTKQGRTK